MVAHDLNKQFSPQDVVHINLAGSAIRFQEFKRTFDLLHDGEKRNLLIAILKEEENRIFFDQVLELMDEIEDTMLMKTMIEVKEKNQFLTDAETKEFLNSLDS